jgi:hypothetical protein
MKSVQKSCGMNAVPVVLVWYTEPAAMHAVASAVALVAASVELVPVSGTLASSVVLASGVPASVVAPELAPLPVPEALPELVVPEPLPVVDVPALAPLVVPDAVLPVLAPVPLPDEVPVLPEDAGLLLLLHAAARNPTVTPRPNLLRTFIFIPSISKETRRNCGRRLRFKRARVKCRSSNSGNEITADSI